VLWSGSIGGIQRQVAALVRAAAAHGSLRHEALFLEGRGTVAEELEAEGLALRLYYRRRSYVPVHISLIRALQTKSPAVVHVHSPLPVKTVLLAMAARRDAGWIYTQRSPGALDRTRKARIFYSFLHARFDRFIATTSVMAACVSTYGVEPESIVVIPNARTLPIRQGAATSTPRLIGTVARLSRQKRIDIFLDVVAELHGRGIDCSGLIVGDGPLREELVRYRDILGLERVVQFVGEQEDVALWLDRFDVLFITSSSEPFGNVAVEGMARHVPVVAMPARGGLVEIVSAGGLLLEDWDVGRAADALETLLHDRDARDALRQRADQALPEYDPASIVAKLERLYAEVVPGLSPRIRG